MSYGLEVYNASNQLMFDTTKGLSSYVVRSYGVASEITLNSGDILFVKPTNADLSYANRYYFAENSYGNVYQFKYGNPANSTTKTSTNLDYFVICPSANIGGTGDYGLVIYNEDGTTQFDSRGVLSDKHFQILNSYSFPDIYNTNVCNALPDGTSGEYLSISRIDSNTPSSWTYYNRSDYVWPSGSRQGQELDRWEAAYFINRPAFRTLMCAAYYHYEDLQDEDLRSGATSITTTSYGVRISSQILIGRLI